MTDHRTHDDDPTAELLATSGLVTLIGAVVAGVIAVVSLGDGNVALAGLLGAVALTSFVASLVLFSVDSRRSEGSDAAPLPFPSWLRAEPETVAEPV